MEPGGIVDDSGGMKVLTEMMQDGGERYLAGGFGEMDTHINVAAGADCGTKAAPCSVLAARRLDFG